MWRVKEAEETKDETHEALRGATGSGNVAIGPNTGSVTNIGNNAAAATTVNVGNTGTSAFGTVNVGRGATAVFIGDNVASAITLGRSTGSVTLGPPLTLGAAPTTSGHLGGQQTATFITNFLNAGTFTSTYSISLSPGTWIIIGNGYFPSVTTFSLLSISNTTGTPDNFSMSLVQASGNMALNVTRCVNIASGNQTWYLIGQTYSSLTLSQSSFYAVRIG